MTCKIAVIFNHDVEEAAVRALLSKATDASSYEFAFFPVQPGPQLYRSIRLIKAGVPQKYTHVLNLCCGQEESGSVSAATAALLLDKCAVPYSGCRASTLGYSLDVLFMMMVYAEVPLPRFKAIQTCAAAADASRELRLPVMVRSATPFLKEYSMLAASTAELESSLKHVCEEYGHALAWECPGASSSATTEEVELLVSGGATKGALSVAAVSGDAKVLGSDLLERVAASFSSSVLYSCGTALLRFAAVPSASDSNKPPSWQLVDITLNPSLVGLRSAHLTPTVVSQLLRDAAADASAQVERPNFEVRLHEDSRKGYHLCATRSIKKGEIVFPDETRSFALVTRPFVEKNWNKELQKMFTEYAWPVDSEGHTYAIWENDPTRWRPINHSCDPNCVFDAPHSLNTIAARDIAEGEDISMDYATFCDGTMKPFHCLCGAECCRDFIVPDKPALEKYGEHAWFRKVPPPRAPLV